MRDADTFSDVDTVFHQYHFFGGSGAPLGTIKDISGHQGVRIIWIITGIEVAPFSTVDASLRLSHETSLADREYVGARDIIGPLWEEPILSGQYRNLYFDDASNGTHIVVPVAYVGGRHRIIPEIEVDILGTVTLRCFCVLQLTPTSGIGSERYPLVGAQC